MAAYNRCMVVTSDALGSEVARGSVDRCPVRLIAPYVYAKPQTASFDARSGFQLTLNVHAAASTQPTNIQPQEYRPARAAAYTQHTSSYLANARQGQKNKADVSHTSSYRRELL